MKYFESETMKMTTFSNNNLIVAQKIQILIKKYIQES